MEGSSIGARVCRGVTSCWLRRRSYNNGGYQRLRPSRGTRLARRTTAILGSSASSWSWRFGRLRLRRRCCAVMAPPRSWSSPLQLLNRILDTYIASMLSQPLTMLKAAGVSSSSSSSAAAVPAAAAVWSLPPKVLRRDGSPGSGSGSRRRDATGGKGVMLNICVAEVLLRRSTSEVRRSPLRVQQQTPTKDARHNSSVHHA